jgi:hypothetical protein
LQYRAREARIWSAVLTTLTEEIYLHAFDKNETTLAAVRSVQERRLAAG